METTIQIAQFILTLLGLLFIWIQIKRNSKDSMTSSFIASISERWLAIEDRRLNRTKDELKGYYEFLKPILEGILLNEYEGNLRAFANTYLFNQSERDIIDEEKVFNIIISEYADFGALMNLSEEEFLIGKHMQLVDKRLWKYWEYYLRLPFDSERGRLYWKLRLKYGVTFPDFIEFVENSYLNIAPKWKIEKLDPKSA